MSLRTLIFDGGAVEAAFLANDDATVLSLLNNDKSVWVLLSKTVDYVMVLEANNARFAGEFVLALESHRDTLLASANADDNKDGAVLQSQLVAFPSVGINLAAAQSRDLVVAAMDAAGWGAAKKNNILGLSRVRKTPVEILFGRPAEQADIDELRIQLFVEKQEERRGRLWWDAMYAGDKAAFEAGLAAHLAESQAE